MSNRIDQIRRSHNSARPKQSNPAWVNTHNDLGVALDEVERLKIEAACNYCGKYHGREACQQLLAVYEAAKRIRQFPISSSHYITLDHTIAVVQTRQEKTCAGCGCKWHHDSVWCPDCAIKRLALSRQDGLCPNFNLLLDDDYCHECEKTVGEGQSEQCDHIHKGRIYAVCKNCGYRSPPEKRGLVPEPDGEGQK